MLLLTLQPLGLLFQVQPTNNFGNSFFAFLSDFNHKKCKLQVGSFKKLFFFSENAFAFFNHVFSHQQLDSVHLVVFSRRIKEIQTASQVHFAVSGFMSGPFLSEIFQLLFLFPTSKLNLYTQPTELVRILKVQYIFFSIQANSFRKYMFSHITPVPPTHLYFLQYTQKYHHTK